MEVQPRRISDLRSHTTGWRIRVKVLRTWLEDSKDFGLSLEMILSDDQGNKIVASVNGNLIKEFSSKLPLLQWKIIDYFIVNPNYGERRSDAVPNRMKIRLLPGTTIYPSSNVSESLFFEFTNFGDFPSPWSFIKQAMDVIGYVDDFGTLDELHCIAVNKKIPMLKFTLKNERNETLKCVAWNERASEVYYLFKHFKDQGMVICILRWWIVDPTGEELHTNGKCSEIFANLDIDDVAKFKANQLTKKYRKVLAEYEKVVQKKQSSSVHRERLEYKELALVCKLRHLESPFHRWIELEFDKIHPVPAYIRNLTDSYMYHYPDVDHVPVVVIS